MTISRRTVMRGIALAPAFSLIDCSQTPRHDSESTDLCWVNILTHGLFFMEFQPESRPDTLVLTAPVCEAHQYCTVNNGFLTEFPANKRLRMNLGTSSLTGLLPGKIASFDDHPAIPQFSRSQTKVGDLVGEDYRLRIELPLPHNILAFRCGSLDDFIAAAEPGHVKDSVVSACGKRGNKRFALITCFRYLKGLTNACPPVATHSFYAEGIHVDSYALNQCYAAAGKLFANHKNFDLQVKTGQPRVGLDPHPGFGVSADDEKSLIELMPLPGRVVDVGSCIQLAIVP